MKDRLLMGWIGVVLIAAYILATVPEPEMTAEASVSLSAGLYPAVPYQTAEPTETTLVWAVGACGPVIDAARHIGWPESQLAVLHAVVWRESRCLPDVHNPSDPRGGSWGLAQINGFWCKPNPTTGWPIGYLQHYGILETCDDLYDPHTNLRAALQIWSRSGWAPWSTVG